jgi:hypothetical protein
MLNLEKGMYIRLLVDSVYYDPKTFEPHTIPKGAFGEIEYVGVGLPRDQFTPPVPILSVKFKDGVLTYTGEQFKEFRKTFQIV